MALDRVDPPADPRQDGGLITGAGADFQHRGIAPRRQSLRHDRHDQRPAQRLALTDRQGHVLVGWSWKFAGTKASRGMRSIAESTPVSAMPALRSCITSRILRAGMVIPAYP